MLMQNFNLIDVLTLTQLFLEVSETKLTFPNTNDEPTMTNTETE